MRFFFYGTLMAQSGNPVARRLHTLLTPGVAATVRGHLYAIEDQHGWYPGLAPDPRGGRVHGFLHDSTGQFAADDLAELDRYENFDPLEPDRSEFLRREITVETASGRVLAQAYVLRAPPVKAIVTVAHGSFSSFVRQHRLRPFGAGERPSS